jgi:hypothetical protein
MKTIILSMLLVAGVARADDEPVLIVPARLSALAIESPQRLQLAELLRLREADARHLRTAGMVTTIVGTVVSVVGISLLASGLTAVGEDAGLGGILSGAPMLAIGQLAVVAGIPMWTVGQSRMSRAEAARIAVTPAGIAGRF